MRDDFTQQTKDYLAKRVAFKCSNPYCRRITCGPSGNIKVSTIGQAAHITAASPGGPRYDSSLTKEQRVSLENGIWLCNDCAKLIDSNPTKYTVSLLKRWKKQAEDEIEAEIECRNIKTEEQSLLHGTESLYSNLLNVIFKLSDVDLREATNKLPKSFEIDKKIDYNNLKSAKRTIETYAIYNDKLNELYEQFDKEGINKSLSIQFKVFETYSEVIELDGLTADQIYKETVSRLSDEVMNSSSIHMATEEIYMCINIIVEDAFMRCTIFKNPEGYTNVIADKC